MGSMADKVEDLVESLMLVAIGIGTVALPIFLGVNVTGLDAAQLAMWGTVLTVTFAVIALGFVRHMRSGGRKR